MSCGIGHKHNSDLALLWLAAEAVIQPLALEFPYAVGAALKKKKEVKQMKEIKKEEELNSKMGLL